jgi:hypothetical protein
MTGAECHALLEDRRGATWLRVAEGVVGPG